MVHCPNLLIINKLRFAFGKTKGVTLIELLIVLTVLGFLGLILITSFNPTLKLAKARDARRKADLQKLKNPLEDYFNDHKCYPKEPLMACNPGEGLKPYWSKVPCDPQTNKSYLYQYIDCKTYRIYVNLEDKNDPAIAEVGCSGGCGPSPYYNWGISSSNTNLGGREAEVNNCNGGTWYICQGISNSVCNNTGKTGEDKPVCTGEGIPYCNTGCSGDSCCNNTCGGNNNYCIP